MALIGKIRKNYWVILILLALALASFVIMDILGSRQGGGIMGDSQTTIGSVAGQEIEYNEFEKVERALYSGSSDVYSRRASLWNYLVEKALVEKEADALGLGVSNEELMDLQFGNNLSPIIQNNFKNQQTGQVDRQTLLQYKQAIETNTINGQPLTNEFRNFWAEQEKQIVKTKLQEKISNMVTKGIYVPKWQAEVLNQLNTENVVFNFVKIPFDAIPDSELNLTDEDYKKYLNENAGKYTNTEETRLIDFYTLDVVPSTADSAAILQTVNGLLEGFKSTQNDSLFSATHNGGLSPLFNKSDDFTGELKEKVKTLTVGEVFGPYIEDGRYVLSKLVDKQVVADSVKARHILKSAKTPQDMIAARAAIDSLKNLLTNNVATFDSLAIKNSEDPASGSKGGDLGTFAQGTMVQPFNDACFYGSKEGGLYVVETQFGVHLIQVQKKLYNNQEPKYKVALVTEPIVPSQETQDKIYDTALDLISTNRTSASLQEAIAKHPEIKSETTKSVKANDFMLGNFPQGQTSRDIIKWAFTADKDEVSPNVYTYTDKELYYNKNYVLTSLKAINPAGVMTVDAAKTTIDALVKNAKRGELLKSKITSTDLSAIANQFSVSIDTAANVNFNSGFIPAIQAAEPLVVAKAFNLQEGAVSSPIVGNSGIYVLKLNSKTAATPTDASLIQKSSLASLRSGASYRVWEAVKKLYKPKDNRTKFF